MTCEISSMPSVGFSTATAAATAISAVGSIGGSRTSPEPRSSARPSAIANVEATSNRFFGSGDNAFDSTAFDLRRRRGAAPTGGGIVSCSLRVHEPAARIRSRTAAGP